MATVIIGTIVIGSFVGVLYSMYRKKKKTGSVCGCSGCSGCPSSNICHKK